MDFLALYNVHTWNWDWFFPCFWLTIDSKRESIKWAVRRLSYVVNFNIDIFSETSQASDFKLGPNFVVKPL